MEKLSEQIPQGSPELGMAICGWRPQLWDIGRILEKIKSLILMFILFDTLGRCTITY